MICAALRGGNQCGIEWDPAGGIACQLGVCIREVGWGTGGLLTKIERLW